MFRLMALLGGLSVATDLGAGAPMEESLRRCVVAARLARAAGLPEPEVSDVMYTSILQHIGCTAHAHENAESWGDDVVSVRLSFLTDFTRPTDVWSTWVTGMAEATGRSRPRLLAATLATARTTVGQTATCEVARGAARGLGMNAAVQQALFHGLTMWNGGGHPPVRGNEIAGAARFMQVASTAVMFTLHAGRDVALAEVRRRAGKHLDPHLAALTLDRADELLEGIEALDPFQQVLDDEADPVRIVDAAGLVDVARTLGNVVDLKSPWSHGHSARVGALASRAATSLGLRDDATDLLLAGHLHNLGSVGVSSRIWDKAQPLTASELDQARLHPYHGERIIARVTELARVATLVGQHHERCDGSGYHRGLGAAQLSFPSRLLATADRYCNLVEERPGRAGLSDDAAAEQLRAEVRTGWLDPTAVAAVLRSAGHRGGPRPRPAGLTERQVEVLRLVAGGLSNPEIAERLHISRRTAEHHVQDVYMRIGVSSRAGAAMFAMEHGLYAESG